MITKKSKSLLTLLLCFLLLLSNVFCFNVVQAQVNADSGVLEDLSKDKNFNILSYPEKEDDYSLNVIHLSEGESGAVYLYVYQPSGTKKMLKALSINMCTKDYNHYYTADKEEDNNLPFFVNYPLELIDYEGTLFKYKIKTFVSDDYWWGSYVSLQDYNYQKDLNFQTNGVFDKTLTRNYEVSTIYRDFIPDVDVAVDSGAIDNKKGLKVGKMFSITSSSDGSNSIKTEKIDVVSVIGSFCGSIRYETSDYFIFDTAVDSWFFSFSVDREIEKLLEVDVFYNCSDYSKHYPSRLFDIVHLYDVFVGNYVTSVVSEYSVRSTISHTDSAIIDGGWFCDDRGFKRILTSSDFLLSDGLALNEDAKSKIKKYDWVLRFAETQVLESGYNDEKDYSLISNVSLLRLKFETDGVVYNLGVVDDMRTPDGIPDGIVAATCGGFTWQQILGMVAIIILLILLAPVLPYILSFLITIISLPFKFFAKLAKKAKKNKKSRKNGE